MDATVREALIQVTSHKNYILKVTGKSDSPLKAQKTTFLGRLWNRITGKNVKEISKVASLVQDQGDLFAITNLTEMDLVDKLRSRINKTNVPLNSEIYRNTAGAELKLNTSLRVFRENEIDHSLKDVRSRDKNEFLDLLELEEDASEDQVQEKVLLLLRNIAISKFAGEPDSVRKAQQVGAEVIEKCVEYYPEMTSKLVQEYKDNFYADFENEIFYANLLDIKGTRDQDEFLKVIGLPANADNKEIQDKVVELLHNLTEEKPALKPNFATAFARTTAEFIEVYGETFPDLLNTLKVDYEAKYPEPK